MDIKTIMQDERKKKFLIIGLVAFLVIIGVIFFLLRTPATPQANNDQLLSDLAKLAPRDGLLDTDRTIAPIINVSSDTTTVAPGQPAVISWNSDNATSCADGDGNVILNSGSLSISPRENYTLDVVCTNPKGTSLESVTVAVTTSPIIALSAYPNPVKSGDQSLISWNTTNTTRCVDSTGKTLRLSGSFSVVINKAYTFEMSCTGPNGAGKNLVTVAIASSQAKIIATKTTITTAPNTATTITTATKTDTTGSKTVTNTRTITPTGKSSIVMRASATTIKYGESSTISWSTENVTNCTGTTPTGVEMLLLSTGETGIILMPGAPRMPLPNNGQVSIRVLEGKTKATLTIQCTGADGAKTERSITVTSAVQSPIECASFGRPIIRTSANPTRVESGSPAFITWSAKCATKCTADVVPWGELIYYTDTSTITDYIDGQDYNKYTSTRSLLNLAVNTSGGARVYPGRADPSPVLLTPVCDQGGDSYCFTPPTPSDATVTLKCTNSSGSTPYTTTKSVSVPIIVHPSCGGWFSCFFETIVDVVKDVGSAVGQVDPATWVDPLFQEVFNN